VAGDVNDLGWITGRLIDEANVARPFLALPY
jgi:hypothetical protein